MAQAHLAAIHLVSADDAVVEACGRVLGERGCLVRVHDDARKFSAHRHARSAGCLVVDLDLPEGMVIELQRLAHEVQPRLSVLCVATRAGVAQAVRALRAGATDVLALPADLDRLANAVDAAIAAGLQWRQDDARRTRAGQLIGRLTAREHAVLALLLEGKPNKVIAAHLGSQEGTVKVHRCRLMRKLEVRSLVDLFRLTHEFGDAFARQEAGVDPQGGLHDGAPPHRQAARATPPRRSAWLRTEAQTG